MSLMSHTAFNPWFYVEQLHRFEGGSTKYSVAVFVALFADKYMNI